MTSYFVTINSREFEVRFEKEEAVFVNGEQIAVDILPLDERSFSVLIDGRSEKVIAQGNSGIYQVQVGGHQLEATIETERSRLLKQFERQSGGPVAKSEIRAPMPALVVKIEVKVGDEVKAGQGLVILEAMKMENEIKSQGSGTVKEIRVTPGKPVEKGELIMILDNDDSK